MWFRDFSPPHVMAAGLKTLLPRFNLGKIHAVLGRTSALVRSDRTGKLLSRHVSDLQPFSAALRFSEQDSWEDNEARYWKERRGEDLGLSPRDQHLEQQATKDAVEDERKNFEQSHRFNTNADQKMANGDKKAASDVRPKEKEPKPASGGMTLHDTRNDEHDTRDDAHDTGEEDSEELAEAPRRSARLRGKPSKSYKE